MQTFKRVIVSSLSFLLILAIVSCAILIPWKNSESGYYMDSKLRGNLAGEIDFVVIGASHGLAAFIPRIIDDELGCYSYNLCGSLMTMNSRTYLLKKELNRNPIKTVVLEISYNALTRTYEKDYGDGEFITLLRLDSFPERLSYMIQYVDFNDWLNIYCRDMNSALSDWRSALIHNVSCVNYEAKGYKSKETVNIALSNDEIIESYNSSSAAGEFTSANMEQFYELIKSCKEKNCEIYVVCTPVSDSCIWRNDDWDVFYTEMYKICEEQGVEWLDFNLLKDRYDIFSDSETFYDELHLSNNGAELFTHAFTKVVNLYRSGTDVSDMFYNSYSEMKNDSPYMDYYLTRE